MGKVFQTACKIIIQFLLPQFGQRIGRVRQITVQIQLDQFAAIENQGDVAERGLVYTGLLHDKGRL